MNSSNVAPGCMINETESNKELKGPGSFIQGGVITE